MKKYACFVGGILIGLYGGIVVSGKAMDRIIKRGDIIYETDTETIVRGKNIKGKPLEVAWVFDKKSTK